MSYTFGKFVKYISITAVSTALCIQGNAFAGSHWTVTINNNTNAYYEIRNSGSACWHLEDFSSFRRVPAGGTLTLKTEESNKVPFCTVGDHYLNLVSSMPEIKSGTMNNIAFANIKKSDHLPINRPTFMKSIQWSNPVAPFSRRIECDTFTTATKMNVVMDILENGNIEFSGSNCVSVF